jgi:predicted outer membrane repeat protein
MGDKTTILFIDNTSTFGGAIHSLYHLINYLDQEKFEAILITGQNKNFIESKFNKIIWYHSIPKLSWINNGIYKKVSSLPLFNIRILLKILNIFRYLYWIIFVYVPESYFYYKIGKKHNVSIIHLNNILSGQLAGIIASKLLGVPCVAHLRAFEEDHFITRFYARWIDHHIAISEAIRDNLLVLEVPGDHISVIYNSVDIEHYEGTIEHAYLFREFSIAPEQLRYGICGRLVEWKGIREFIYAAQIVAVKFPGSKAFIIGGVSDGDESFELEMHELVTSLNLGKNIIFTGYRSDILALTSFLDVVVHASNLPEPFGRVLIEGMAMKKPVVATKGGGPLEIIVDGKTGFLVEMGNSKVLAESIMALLGQPNLRSKMGLAGKERVLKLFNATINAGKLEAIYEQLVSKNK